MLKVNSATEGACEFSPTVRRRKRTSSPPQTYSPLQHSPLQHSPLQHSPLQHSPKNRSSQHYSPRLTQRRHSTSGRVLKVVVAKMRLEGSSEAGAGAGGGGGGEGGAGDGGGEGGAGLKRVSRGTPPPGRSKHMRFDAPSPNGTTDAGVIVS
ncbi:unnamed protein product [Diatraea saccharalis]|uniref:Uncharacterized protein n=1 Tax=Diatraea saccharalis TaxID=40085 RepID=A0A9N9QWK6_9NEOP|nr:unnamed protein product [Diatraea saccharalis]